MRIEFTRARTHTHKRADITVHFDQAEGILDGGRLEGFGLFEHAGGEMRVTFPAQAVSIQGDRRPYALLRGTPAFVAAIEGAILVAWRELTKAERVAHMTGKAQPLPGGGSVEPSGFVWAPDEPAQAKP